MTKRYWTIGTLTYGTGALAALFFWLLWGDFAWSMKDRAVGNVATLMVKSFGVSDFVYGLLILSFPNFTNVILGPIVSYYSDRHRGRFGRRIPFLAFTVPIIVCGLAGLGVTPKLAEWLCGLPGAEGLSRHTASLLWFGLFWIMFDFGNTLASVLFTALVNDVVPREFLGRFFGLFRAISLGAGVFFNYCLMEYAEAYSMPIFLGLAVLYAAGFSMLLLNVKEGEYPPVDPGDRSSANPFVIMRIYARECFSLKPCRILLFALPVAMLANIPLNAYGIFYAKSLDISMGAYGKYLACTYIISFFLSYLLGLLSDWYHPIRTGIATLVLYGLLCFAGFFLVSGKISFAIVFIMHGVLTGSLLTLTASYGPRLFPRARFAQFNSAMWLLLSFSWMIMTPIVGKFLDLIGNRYEYTLLLGGLLSVAGIHMLLQAHRVYRQFGGDGGYRAPEAAGEQPKSKEAPL